MSGLTTEDTENTERATPETDDQPIIYAINEFGYQVPCVALEFARGGGAMSGWIDAQQELPDEETDVIVATEDGHVEAGFLLEGKWRWLAAEQIKVRVTHWQHFPEPPTEGGK